ncbi:hypothetical protein Trydic_g1148 [Trypoxylus dichotomus]
MSLTQIEFAVQMTCDSCVKAVEKIDTYLSTQEVQKLLQNSGRKAVVKGYAGQHAGVAILDTGTPSIKGVVRFIQINNDTCVVDGVVDGLQPGLHNLSVHECGDLSKGCENVGDFFHPHDSNVSNRIYGNLGAINAGTTGRAAFRFEDNVLKLPDVIDLPGYLKTLKQYVLVMVFLYGMRGICQKLAYKMLHKNV